jgi:hypothetical protein
MTRKLRSLPGGKANLSTPRQKHGIVIPVSSCLPSGAAGVAPGSLDQREERAKRGWDASDAAHCSGLRCCSGSHFDRAGLGLRRESARALDQEGQPCPDAATQLPTAPRQRMLARTKIRGLRSHHFPRRVKVWPLFALRSLYASVMCRLRVADSFTA